MIFIEEEDKLNPSPTVESDPKPKSGPFVTSIGSPKSVGKERCPVSGGTWGGWHCVITKLLYEKYSELATRYCTS